MIIHRSEFFHGQRHSGCHNAVTGKTSVTITADRIFRFKLVKRDFGPLASSIILHIARAHRIGGNLAQVVEERNGKQRITGILIGCPQVRNFQKPLCNGDGMRTQAAFLSPMKPGTCRCSVEIGCFQPCHHLVDTRAGDAFCHFNELFFRCHNKSSLSYNAKRGGPPEMGSPPL